jgi:exopolyphosphatase / guanosine-5'-triphosphate,3'-diphosphate pyrophosphatase
MKTDPKGKSPPAAEPTDTATLPHTERRKKQRRGSRSSRGAARWRGFRRLAASVVRDRRRHAERRRPPPHSAASDAGLDVTTSLHYRHVEPGPQDWRSPLESYIGEANKGNPEGAIATLEHQIGDAEKTKFPLRAAALDVGSNAIRYYFVEFSDVDRYVELDTQRFPVRLGHDAFSGGVLSAETLDAAVAAAGQFRKQLDELGVGHYRAVATSAVRESRNGGELVERIRRESGVRLETITGSEEARLVWLAAKHRLSFDQKPWILADLGGGSIEISIVSELGIHWSESHQMGTVRLLEDFGGGVADGEDFRDLLEHYTSRLSLPEGVEREVEGIVITGGNAEALADLIENRREVNGITEITRPDLQEVLAHLSAMTFEERVQKLGLREDRADVIVPAAVIFDRVAELADSERILVPRVGVKEGVLFDLAADVAEHRAHETELDRATLTGAIALGRRYRFDEIHARHVADLALSLFDQLETVHGLGETSKRRLAAAALLHDIGQFVSYRRHHKHSWYLVTHSDLPGLTPEDVRLVALVTRYHRRSVPKPYHEGYAELKESEKVEVSKLSAILRVADALDREHRRRVRRVTAKVKQDKVSLTLDAVGPTPLEEWSLRKKADLFESIFDVKLQLN